MTLDPDWVAVGPDNALEPRPDFPEITAVERLVLQPWETLLVRVPGRLTLEQAFKLREHVLNVLPKGARVLVADSGITFEVVVASESEP